MTSLRTLNVHEALSIRVWDYVLLIMRQKKLFREKKNTLYFRCLVSNKKIKESMSLGKGTT